VRWDDFERLCVRLIRVDADIERCQLYGIPGQPDYGVDLFARHRYDKAYGVYQCKKVAEFSPPDIVAAVNKFKAGPWADQATSFTICVTTSGARTQLANELESQAQRLWEKGVTFLLWDLEEISTRLKEHPALVDDFFGREWTKAFCGEQAVKTLGPRLDANAFISYRANMKAFYEAVFNQFDPGIPVPPQPGVPAIPLGDRLALPDIVSVEWGPAVFDMEVLTETGGSPSEELLQIEPGSQIAGYLPRPSGRHLRRTSAGSYRPPVPVDSWLAKSERSIILGGPGSGKSSLLRYLVLELLSDSPSLLAVSQRWGDKVPIWLPFAYWTKLIADGVGGQVSISECLRSWLGEWNQGSEWPLVKQAIADARLLLIVDGIDEWVSEVSGQRGHTDASGICGDSQHCCSGCWPPLWISPHADSW
jgi:hypothetical protein